MRTAIYTSSLTHGSLMGALVAACVAREPFGTRTTDKLTGI